MGNYLSKITQPIDQLNTQIPVEMAIECFILAFVRIYAQSNLGCYQKSEAA